MSRPILSVLIPTRNRGSYLSYAIESAINIPDEDVEILVSENYSHDCSLEVANSFKDKRLTVLRPKKPLPMHANWEFLLSKATGEWIYFLGDDDAMMPHVASYLRYIAIKYPECEALVTPRAYYFWPGTLDTTDGDILQADFHNYERWMDSKMLLNDLLDAKEIYLNGPQFYSGGFHRRSLVRRVLNAQNGVYFKSVTPDAYGALMACVHTYRYLATGIPLAWVGTSDGKASFEGGNSAQLETKSKDRILDFYGLQNDDELVIHKALGDLKACSLSMVFYEAYLSAIPTTSYKELNRERLLRILTNAKDVFEFKKESTEYSKLINYLGFHASEIDRHSKIMYYRNLYERYRNRIIRSVKRLLIWWSKDSQVERIKWARHLASKSYSEYPNILSASSWTDSTFEDFKRNCLQD
jgi:glycosyltransferase involved in cell wall biosynthesis